MSSELTFGKYRLTERLAYGGMAEVFLARAQGVAGFEKTVVIKRLHPHFSEDREFVSMLIDEAHLVSQLTHVNICQVLDLGEVDGTYYIALEFIDGRDLFSIMRALRRAGRHLPIEAAVYVTNEVLEGLGYAHRKCSDDGRPLGIVHRDVSPQNVLATREGEVKIIDFGIAKARMRQTRTQTGILKGKYRYMAPEQAEGRAVDERSDLFATGIVLYELCAGQVHGRGLSDIQLLERVRTATFEPIRALRPEVPPALEAIIQQALQRDPRARFQCAADFQDALAGFLHGTGIEFTKRDLGALVRGLFPAGTGGKPLDDNATVPRAGTPASSRRRVVEVLSEADGTAIEEAELLEEDALEEESAEDRTEAADGPDPNAGATTLERTPRGRAVSQVIQQAAAAPPRRERPPRITRPAQVPQFPETREKAPWQPGPAAPPPNLRAPEPQPFAAPAPPPRAPVMPGGTTAPERPAARAATGSRRAPAPAPAPSALPDPPEVAAQKGLSRGGKMAMIVTVLLLGGAGAGALLFYNPDQYQARPRAPAAAPQGSLYVTSKPAGASIFVDGKPTGHRTPDTLDGLPVGRPLRLELQLEGYQRWSLDLSVSEEEPTPVMAELTREGGPPGRRRR